MSDIIILFIVAMLFTALGALSVEMDSEYHKEIVKRGCGEYNSTTSKFQWIKTK